MSIKLEDKCANCGHTFFWHAPDMQTEKNKCWHGSVTGDSCEKQCLDFVPLGVK
jgi:hypothetical protein